MSQRDALIRDIMAYSFMLDELTLYLDTHPKCPHGLAAYKKYKAMYEAAKQKFTENFGPLTSDEVTDDSCWTWINNPWPWERSGN